MSHYTINNNNEAASLSNNASTNHTPAKYDGHQSPNSSQMQYNNIDNHINHPTYAQPTRFELQNSGIFKRSHDHNCYVHLGQCGVQMGIAMWEMLNMESGVSFDGKLCEGVEVDSFDLERNYDSHQRNKETHPRGVPRAIFADLDEETINDVRIGVHKSLIHPHNLMTDYEDAGGIWSKAARDDGSKKFCDDILERIRKICENCGPLRNIIFVTSLCGGAGNGILTNLLNVMDEKSLHPKTCKTVVSHMPSANTHTSVLEPYNFGFGMEAVQKYSDVSLCFDNESLYHICEEKLKIDQPSFPTLNRIVSKAMSAVMLPSTKFTIKGMISSLVLSPRQKFPFMAFAPLVSIGMSGNQAVGIMTDVLTKQVMSRENQFLACNRKEGKNIASVLLYRGDVTHGETIRTLLKLNDENYQQKLPNNRPTLSQYSESKQRNLNNKNTNNLSPDNLHKIMQTTLSREHGSEKETNIGSDFRRHVNVDNAVRSKDWRPWAFKVWIDENAPFEDDMTTIMQNPKKQCTLFCNHTSISQIFYRQFLKMSTLLSKSSYKEWYIRNNMTDDEFSEQCQNLRETALEYATMADEGGDDDTAAPNATDTQSSNWSSFGMTVSTGNI